MTRSLNSVRTLAAPNEAMREADLSKHLANDRQEKAAAGDTPTRNAFNFTPAARPQDVDEKDLRPEPGAVVAKSDYELSQAVAFLKSRSLTRTSANSN